MAIKALTIVNGAPRMTIISGTSIYDDVTVVGAGGITAGTPVTLPNAGEYQDKDLEIYLRGQFLEPGYDFNYVGNTIIKTQVTFTNNLIEGDRIHWRVEGVPTQIYDEVIVYNSTLSTGTPITLPNGKDFNGDDLEVYLRGQYMEPLIDYNYVGTAPYTQIAMTFDLIATDRLRLRID